MATETWRETTVGALCDQGFLLTQTGPFGSQLHSYDYVASGVPVVPTEAIGRRRLAKEGVPQISEETASRLSRHRLKTGDILFARRGAQATGLSAPVTTVQNGWICGTGAILLRIVDQSIDSNFLSFLFASDDSIQWLKQHAVGAVMPNLNESVIRGLPLKLPPLPQQKAIARILGTLDDKIELNRRMNATLEATARAMFRSWFVDFDPVRAKAAGRQPAGMDEATAALFPDSFQESELGEIPRGWETDVLDSFLNVVKGRSYKSSELSESKTALVTLKSFQRGGGYRADGLKSFTGDFKPNQRVVPGEVVVACTDVTQAAEVIGRPAIVRGDANYDTLVASLDVGIVRPISDRVSIPFLYCLFLTDRFQAHTYAHATGTTVLHLSSTALPSFECCIPTRHIGQAFARLTKPLFQLVDQNEQQSRTLVSLRNALLPKLLSGELSVVSMRDEIEVA